ncbi:unnamed protein product [Medioppia subpectinata]|uniref:Uncharacterized protein n=1 Tax=Medioppia subpectinata TaxID=1979941 RepID=A0A7R9Q9W6_9ACAR|nr:unnamed protein product [Medioppia subpectinata]CAG2116662.1 unnamed protein product [Medioppia subpectinata]
MVFFYEFGTNLFGLRRRVTSGRRLDDKVVVITGANTGIGKETAYLLSLRGAKIYIGCRDIKKGETAIQEIKARNPDSNLTLFKLDLSSLKSVRYFANQIKNTEKTVDLLINNAGVMACPPSVSADGYELQLATNHLGHFLLTLHLLPLMKRSKSARIVNVSSCAHLVGQIDLDNINLKHNAYDPFKAYAQSKLCNVLFTRELAKRLPGSNINAYALHPGIIDTEIARHGKPANGFMKRYLVLNAFMGSQTTLYCAVDESLDNESGYYYELIICHLNI